MTRAFSRWLDAIAARRLSRRAVTRRRMTVKERARQLCEEMGKPIPEALQEHRRA